MKSKPGRPRSKTKQTKQEWEAKLLELKFRRESGEVLEAAQVKRVWSGMLIGLRQTINHIDALTLPQRAEVLKELADLPLEKYL